MKKMIIPILIIGLSFAQFEAGKKMVSGSVSNFEMDNTTWTSGDSEIAYNKITADMTPSGSYFVIDNFALSLGLEYEMVSETLTDGDTEIDITPPADALAPFGFSVGGAYYMGDAYGHGSFVQEKPASASFVGDAVQYLAFGGGYLVKLLDGVYLDTKVSYRHYLGDGAAAPEDPPTHLSDWLDTMPGVTSTSMKLYGSVGISVVF